VKTKTRMRLLTMNKNEREKRLDELNQKLKTAQSQGLVNSDLEEREWLIKKLGYKKH
jgi:hypothetical protein